MNLRKVILIGIVLVLLLGVFSIYEFIRFNDDKLHLIFCNVGQGDGILVRSQNGLDVVIDAGPDDSILNCLSNYMPFWDRSIEIAFLTHPHADHMMGFISIFKRYKVLNFATEELSNDTVLYREVIKQAENENLKVKNLYAGDRFKISDGTEIKVVGPSNRFIERTSPNGRIGESKEFGSLELLISLGSFNALLTGDSQIEELNEAQAYFSNIDVFQVPHHGSKYGMDLEILDILKPKLAVISVGKNNYGHPTKFILDLLSEFNIKTLRTDQHGDVEIISDGKSFKVK